MTDTDRERPDPEKAISDTELTEADLANFASGRAWEPKHAPEEAEAPDDIEQGRSESESSETDPSNENPGSPQVGRSTGSTFSRSKRTSSRHSYKASWRSPDPDLSDDDPCSRETPETEAGDPSSPED